MLMIGLTFITGAYYERNVFYKLENVTIEIGEKLPEDILNFIGVINESKNFSIETNAKLDNEGHVMSLGTYSYYFLLRKFSYHFFKSSKCFTFNLLYVSSVTTTSISSTESEPLSCIYLKKNAVVNLSAIKPNNLA